MALGGSIRLYFQDANSIWHVSGASYVNGEYYFSSGDTSCFIAGAKLICTVKEFTEYCEKMAAEEKRMDIIGKNGNDGLHYDNTAQQVESLAINDKPIFTQAMADAGEFPPVGSKLTLFKKTHLKRIDEFLNEELTIIGVSSSLDGQRVITWEHEHIGLCCGVYLTGYFKPIDTRTDRKKMHEKIHSIMTDDSGRFMKFSELPDYTIESYDKLIDTFGLLIC